MKRQKERRKTERFVYKSSLGLELISYGSKGLTQVKHSGRSFDISLGGLGLLTDYPLKRGEVVKLYFPLSRYQTALPVFAQVVWTKPTRNKLRVGMQFLH